MLFRSQIQLELDRNNYTEDNPLVILDPFQMSPLSAYILYKTEELTRIRVTVKGDTEDCDIVSELDPTKEHRIPVIGLYGGRENQVIIENIDDDGNVISQKIIPIQTEPLPKRLTDIVYVEKKTVATSMPLTVISGFGTIYPCAYDSNGDIRWYISEESDGYGYFPLSNNRFIFQSDEALVPTEEKPHTTQMYEMDYLGRIYNVYFTENGMHHEVKEKTPGGNLLISGNSIEGHVEDTAVELDRKTGEVVKEIGRAHV